MKTEFTINVSTNINAKNVIKKARAAGTLATDKKNVASVSVLLCLLLGYNQTISLIKQK